MWGHYTETEKVAIGFHGTLTSFMYLMITLNVSCYTSYSTSLMTTSVLWLCAYDYAYCWLLLDLYMHLLMSHTHTESRLCYTHTHTHTHTESRLCLLLVASWSSYASLKVTYTYTDWIYPRWNLEFLAAILNLGNATFSDSIEACQMEKAECKYNSRYGHKFKYLLSLASYIGPQYCS